MANILPVEKQATVIGALAEGSSIRSVERMTGIHRDTIMRLGVRVGTACQRYMDATMRNLTCERVQVDEIWGFIGKKQAHVTKQDDPTKGDVYTFIALDADTKLIPSFVVGKRDSYHANMFLEDLAARLVNRVQISSDAFSAYVRAVEAGFGSEVDYGQIVKTFVCSELSPGRYSPPDIFTAKKSVIVGDPEARDISTSFVEVHNRTMRMHNRRLTRLTNAFSKKLDNFKASVALYLAYYNFVKSHGTIRCTPAMAAGVTKGFMTVSDLVKLAA